jgi:long-subunit acyl-CoA synthetase (AMP-forming)
MTTTAHAGIAVDAALAEPTLCAAFQLTAAALPQAPALRPVGEEAITWSDYATRVREVATGLAAAGIGTGDAVAILLGNRPEFHVVDSAALHLGAIPFSVYHTNPPEQIVPLLENSGARILVTEPAFLEQARATRALVEDVALVVVDGDGSDHETLADLARRRAPAGFDFDAAWRGVEPDAIATIVYTSGTTGAPKGVQHTHAGLIYGVQCMDDLCPVSADGRVVSYLPMAHIAERFFSHYMGLLFGFAVTCVAEPPRLGEALAETHPTRFFGVPRIWEKLAAGIRKMTAADPDGPLARALAAGLDDVRARQAGRPAPPIDDTDRSTLAAVRGRLGLDSLEYAPVAAAPCAVEVLELFHALGVEVLEFWGMSECMFAVSNPPGGARLGSVGQPVPGVEVALADDGEILVRGRTVMIGYRNEPGKTSDTIDADGWLHSGDIAVADDDGYLRIVDRKKELIINSGGKNMSPSKIELAVKSGCDLIAQVVAIGDRRPCVTALVVLDEEAALSFARANGIDEDIAAVAADDRVRALVADAVAAGNERLARVEQVKAHSILPTAWAPGGDELTPTMKLKRRPIGEKYAAEVDALYAPTGS